MALQSSRPYANSLIPMNDANLSSANDFSQCQSMEDIGMRLLKAVGLAEDAMTPAMIGQAIEANDAFIARLERIAAVN
jgi:hypothetical protein